MEGAQEEGEEGPLDELCEHQTHSVKGMETFVYYMAVQLSVVAGNIIMVKDVVWRFVGEEGSSVGLKNITILCSRRLRSVRMMIQLAWSRRVSLAPTGIRCVRTTIYTR